MILTPHSEETRESGSPQWQAGAGAEDHWQNGAPEKAREARWHGGKKNRKERKRAPSAASSLRCMTRRGARRALRALPAAFGGTQAS
jgi:hypothetical protein